MNSRIFLLAGFLLLSCGCKNGTVHGETTTSAAAKPVALIQPRKPLIAVGPVVAVDPIPQAPCATVRCAMIYCQNSLPAIPSQGICCQRCVTNPKCNTTECPKMKCVAGLAPANLTAGECCDHCAPLPTPATTTKASPKQEVDDDDDDDEDDESGNVEDESSEEQNNGKRGPCNLRRYKHKEPNSHVLRALSYKSNGGGCPFAGSNKRRAIFHK